MDYVPVIVVLGWLISLGVALFVVPKLAARRAMENFGLARVEQDGKYLFVPVGSDGQPVKVPLATREKEDGSVEIVYGYSTLPITLIHMVAGETAKAVKFSLLSAKGKVATELNKASLAGELVAAGIDGATMAVISQLPKKWQGPALLIQRALKGSGTPQEEQKKHSGGGFKPGV